MKTKKTKRKNKKLIFFASLFYLLGIGVLLYPLWSEWINSKHQSGAIASYEKVVAKQDKKEIHKLWSRAEDYNKKLYAKGTSLYKGKGNFDHYQQQLLLPGTDVIGAIMIPSINVNLPIYHGTSAAVLEVGVGQMEGTSLPVGGKNTHCVLTGHTGLPSGGQLFTPLVEMKKGNIFAIKVLNRTLYYQVDAINVVKPGDTRLLGITPGKDYVTLLTCTPYGINDHRLLVRGERIHINLDAPANAEKISPWLVWFIFTCILLIGDGIIILLRHHKKKIKQQEEQMNEQAKETN